MHADLGLDITVAQGRTARLPHRPGLSAGIQSLAIVAFASTAATLVMTVTTAAHIAWPDAAFVSLALAIVAAVVVAHARRVSLAQSTFVLGVVVASVPSLLVASHHWLSHWDDFMTWLPNALYVWKMGGFPTVEAPPVASDLPGYPPGTSIMLAAAWSLAGRVVDDAGPMLNVVCLMILPGLVLRAAGIERSSALRLFGIGLMLGLAATTLNPGLDWHWVLSSLPETATLVAFAAAFVLSAECLFRRSPDAGPRLIALAAILTLIVNSKQTGVVLVGILIVSAALVASIARDDVRRDLRDAGLTLALVLLPSIVVWLCWHLYVTEIFTAHAVAFRPLDQWSYALLPALLGAIADTIASHWLFFLPIGLVVARGYVVLVRGWTNRGGMPPTMGDRLAATFALIETAYLGFLLVCYIGAFTDTETARAAEFFRYQAEIGAAGLIAAVVLAAERARQLRFSVLAPAVLAAQLAALALMWPAAGLYQYAGVLSPAEVESVRRLGREAGDTIVARDKAADVTMVIAAHPLAVLIMRYEMWARAFAQMAGVDIVAVDDTGAFFSALTAAAQRAGPAVGLIDDGPRCGFYVDGRAAELLSADEAPAHCASLLARLEGGAVARRALGKEDDTSAQ